MPVSRGVFNIEMAVRKLSLRFRRTSQVSRPEWPAITATRPLFYLIRIFGLAPFGIFEDDFICGTYDVIYSLVCFLVQTYLAYLVLYRFAGIKRGRATLDITETAKVVINYFVAALNVLVAVWTRKKFIGVLNIVKHFDSRIRVLAFPRTEGATKVFVWSTGVCTAFLWITVSGMGIIGFGESWATNVEYLINYLATALSVIKFSSVVLLLGQRFRHLNEMAQRSKESTMSSRKYIGIDFKVIQQLHNSLMNASESLNSQYSGPLFLWLVNLCAHSISNLYFLIDWLMITPTELVKSQWALVTCLTWWLVTFVAQLLLLHVTCHYTSSEANYMGSILISWKFLAVSRNNRLEPSLHLINRRLNFSAGGCFYVNLPLLRSITAILTTYLVLLLQFRG